MKRRRIRPRTDIPDWRDPNMPVIRDYKMQDGSRKTVVDPDYEHRYREFMVSDPNRRYPNWRDDPTYYGKKQCHTTNNLPNQSPSPKARGISQPIEDIAATLQDALEKLRSR